MTQCSKRRRCGRFGDSARFRAAAAEAFARAGRHEEAAELSWTNFAEHPFLRTFQSLKLSSGPAFPRKREQALTILQEQAAEHGVWPPFVDVLIWDQDMPRVWETATEHEARDSAWLTLARWRAPIHGADAASVLQDLARASVGARQLCVRGGGAVPHRGHGLRQRRPRRG